MDKKDGDSAKKSPPKSEAGGSGVKSKGKEPLKSDSKSRESSAKSSKARHPEVTKRVSNGDNNVVNNDGNNDRDSQNVQEPTAIEAILGEIRKVSGRLDSQAASIQHLKNEWNVKTKQNGKKDAQALSDDEWEDEGMDEQLLGVCDDVIEDEEGDEDEMEEDDDFDEVLSGKDQRGIIPTEEEIRSFKKRTKLGEEFGEDEWRDVKAKSVAKFWVGKPESKDFACPRADYDAPDLRYANRKQGEKNMYDIHKHVGAINLAQLRLGREMKSLVTNTGITMAEFANPEEKMSDPRGEAAGALEQIKNTASDIMKTVSSIGKLSTYTYNKLIAMRRSQFVESVDSSKNARDMVKRVKPSLRFLFGDNLKTVCRILKEGSQLSSTLQKARAGRGGSGPRGRGFRARNGSFGGGRSFRGRGDFRGGFRKRGGKGKASKDG